MKIGSEPDENLVPTSRLGRKKSKFTLKYLNDSIEKEFKDFIQTEISSAVGIKRSENFSAFISSYFAVVTIYLISYISAYLQGNSNQSSLMFQMILLIPVSLFTLIAFGLASLDFCNGKFNISVLQFCFVSTCEAVILCGLAVQSEVFYPKPFTGFQTILGLLPLFYTSKFIVFNGFIQYFIASSFISLSYLIINLCLSSFIQEILLEFLLLSSIIIIETKSFYNVEKKAREKFENIINYISPFKSAEKNSVPKTNIEEIYSTLTESLKIVASGINGKFQDYSGLQKIFENLTNVLNLFGKRTSVYSIDLDNLQGDIDDDDRMFLRETCSKKHFTSARFSTKVIIAQTFELACDSSNEETMRLLRSIGKEWNFDTFLLKELTNNKPLAIVGNFCIKRYSLQVGLSINFSICENFFMAAEDLYKDNPYHNSSHAVDVLISYLYFISDSVLRDNLEDIEIFASIIANLCHDIAHPGVTNRFLVNCKDSLAILCNFYLDNDISVLEMMHCSTIFKIIQEENCNLLQGLVKSDEISVRTLVIEMVLATDMARHFDCLGKFKAKLINSENLPFDNTDQRWEIMRICIKASDVGHSAKSSELHQQWSGLVIKEFFAQGDKEKEKGLPVSMYCDRATTDIPKSQSGFIRNIVLPLYDILHSGLKSSKIKSVCIKQLEANLATWEFMSQKKRGMTQEYKSEKKRLKKSRGDLTVKANGTREWHK